MKILVSLILLVLLANEIIPQEKDSSSISTDFFIYPFLFYSPETKLAFGAGGIFYFRDTTKQFAKPSKVVYSAFYTTNNQYTAFINPEIYLSEESYFITGSFQFSKILDKFYGIGHSTPEIDDPLYQEKLFLADISFNFIYGRDILTGIRYKFESHTSVDPQDNPYLNDESVLGLEGGITSGLGIKLLYDSRDNIFYPTSGFYNEIKLTFNSLALGSRYDFNEYEINFRNYLSLTEDRLLAFEAYFNSVRGYPPFYSMAKLGGEKRMRGYFLGRFRDRTYYALQAEFRTHLFWRILGSLFIAMGDVSSKISTFQLTQAKYSYGFGLRFTLDEQEKLNIRFDMGFGKNTTGIYFNLEEAF